MDLFLSLHVIEIAFMWLELRYNFANIQMLINEMR